MQIKFELLDFQTYLNIEEEIEKIMKMASNGQLVNERIEQLIDLKEEYENNFLRFFDTLSVDPAFALTTHNKLVELAMVPDHKTDEEIYLATYDSKDSHQLHSDDIPGQCWRYELGNIVTVGGWDLGVSHPFNEGDRIEIISFEGGEHEYQYLAGRVGDTANVYLINDEELE